MKQYGKSSVLAPLERGWIPVFIPIQDYLCLGNEARINHPSTLGGNWIWRLHRDEISKKLVKKIRRMTELYCRIPEKTEMLLKAEDAEDLGEEKK